MISSHLIDRDIIPLKTSDTGKEALSIMEDYNIFHLPIVNNEQYLGLITEEDIIQFPIEEAIGSYRLGLSKSYILESDHLFDALSIMGNYELSIVPVIDLKNNYVGVVTETTVIGHFSKSGAFTEKGSLIVLEMKRLDYSLAELTRLIEGENAQILSAFISSPRDANVLEVTLKLNTTNIQPILGTLERFKYKIRATFHDEDYRAGLKNRYDSFMNYLSI